MSGKKFRIDTPTFFYNKWDLFHLCAQSSVGARYLPPPPDPRAIFLIKTIMITYWWGRKHTGGGGVANSLTYIGGGGGGHKKILNKNSLNVNVNAFSIVNNFPCRGYKEKEALIGCHSILVGFILRIN